MVEIMKMLNFQRGFSQFQWLIIVTLIIIFFGLIVIAIDPFGRKKEERDSQRNNDVALLASALKQYLKDHDSVLPTAVQQMTLNEPYMIVAGEKKKECDKDNNRCSSVILNENQCVDLSELTSIGALNTLPVSPSAIKDRPWGSGKTDGDSGTGYTLTRSQYSLKIQACETETRGQIEELITLK